LRRLVFDFLTVNYLSGHELMTLKILSRARLGFGRFWFPP
jgi:hypothetical protein